MGRLPCWLCVRVCADVLVWRPTGAEWSEVALLTCLLTDIGSWLGAPLFSMQALQPPSSGGVMWPHSKSTSVIHGVTPQHSFCQSKCQGQPKFK